MLEIFDIDTNLTTQSLAIVGKQTKGIPCLPAGSCQGFALTIPLRLQYDESDRWRGRDRAAVCGRQLWLYGFYLRHFRRVMRCNDDAVF